MFLMMLVYGVVAIRGLLMKRGFFKPIFAVFTVMLGVLCFADIDGPIAKYHIDAYKSGKLAEVDVNLFYQLSDAAVKQAARLRGDERYGEQVDTYLYTVRNINAGSDSWYDFNIKKHAANKIILTIHAP
jgi:uncharacterized membrane protein